MKIFKYPIKTIDFQGVRMPVGAKILTVQPQFNELCLWAEVDAMADMESRTIRIIGTGHYVPETETLKYIGTVQLDGGGFVFHVYERL